MGLIGQIMSLVFGDGRNAVAETVEVFRANAEKSAQREADFSTETLRQFAAEFAHERKGYFDRFIDGLNRLPRPMLALGTIGLFVSAMYDPIWFSSRMEGIGLVPEPLWWLMGAIVSFYFGARHQVIRSIPTTPRSQNGRRHVIDQDGRLERRIVAIETRNAVDEVHRGNVAKRLSAIEDTLKWLVRLIIGGILIAGLTYVIQGGLVA